MSRLGLKVFFARIIEAAYRYLASLPSRRLVARYSMQYSLVFFRFEPNSL
jgi:hypothetical protein